MADAIKIKQTCSLKHQPNLGEELQEIELEEGTELQVLQEWDDAWLAKTDDGRLLNVKKELAEKA
ncbi:MAG: hypothetical protein V3V67_18060 [Myxococcota bacterium]